LLYEQGKISQIQDEESQDFFRRNLVDFYQRVKILEKMLIMVILWRLPEMMLNCSSKMLRSLLKKQKKQCKK